MMRTRTDDCGGTSQESTMKTATVKIQGTTPYSASAVFRSPKLAREKPDDYEERCWRERLHVTPEGKAAIPGMAFKLALEAAARFRGEKIKGRGNQTYAKRFVSGVLVLEDLALAIKAGDVRGVRLFVPADGVRGSGKRVWKTFPTIDEWGGTVVFTILDDEVIDNEAFESHIAEAGNFIGVGRWRPQNGGLNGRFLVRGVKWS